MILMENISTKYIKNKKSLNQKGKISLFKIFLRKLTIITQLLV